MARAQAHRVVRQSPLRAAVAVAEGGHVDAHPHVEFAPVPARMKTPANLLLGAVMAFGALSFLARFALGLGKATNLSDTWAWGLWIVFDLTWIAVAAGAFATAGLIYVFRRKDLYGLGRSAVLMTLSTMHQSSLGSLFLLMPDKLSHLWWSPVMPVLFFLSSIAAGTALMVVVEFWIAKGFDRAVRIRDAAAMGQIAFVALAVYQAFRFGDLALRGQLAAGTGWGTLALELGLGGVVPLVLLGSARLRQRPALLLTGAALATFGVVLNRVSVVALGMQLKGPMPQIAASSYSPSVVEWGISAGLIAATIFLFAWGVRVLPILPKEEQTP